MIRSELIELLAAKNPHLPQNDVDLVVKTLVETLTEQLSAGGRIEIRGFGSFGVKTRTGRVGRNPKTGEPVQVPEKKVPCFKPGKELRERVDA